MSFLKKVFIFFKLDILTYEERMFFMRDIMHTMPALFIGHGSPMNAIELNEVTRQWREEAAKLPKPKAIILISAHWQTMGTKVTTSESPEMIYDFYGFPKELYEVVYAPKGATDIAQQLLSEYQGSIHADDRWGLDHGAWSVLTHLFPKANIPVVQLSLDRMKSSQEHVDFAKTLRFLRKEGVLIVGSGNIVHNLGHIVFSEDVEGAPWAKEFDQYIKDAILHEDMEKVIQYDSFGDSARLSVPTNEHFLPLLYILALRESGESLHLFAEKIQYSSLSMTSVYIGK